METIVKQNDSIMKGDVTNEEYLQCHKELFQYETPSDTTFSTRNRGKRGNQGNTSGSDKDDQSQGNLPSSESFGQVEYQGKTQKDNPTQVSESKEETSSESSSNFNVSDDPSDKNSAYKIPEKNFVNTSEFIDQDCDLSVTNSSIKSISNRLSQMESITTDSMVKSSPEEMSLNTDVKRQVYQEQAKERSRLSNYEMSIDEEAKSKYSKDQIQDIVDNLREEFKYGQKMIQESNDSLQDLLKPSPHP